MQGNSTKNRLHVSFLTQPFKQKNRLNLHIIVVCNRYPIGIVYAIERINSIRLNKDYQGENTWKN